eukprot:582252-Pelagomonas_calceolata.AAC.1
MYASETIQAACFLLGRRQSRCTPLRPPKLHAFCWEGNTADTDMPLDTAVLNSAVRPPPPQSCAGAG